MLMLRTTQKCWDLITYRSSPPEPAFCLPSPPLLISKCSASFRGSSPESGNISGALDSAMLSQGSMLLKTFSLSTKTSATLSTTSITSPLLHLVNSHPSINARSCHPLLSLPLQKEQSWARSSEPPCLCPAFFSVPINTLYQLYLLVSVSLLDCGQPEARADLSSEHNGWHKKGMQEIFAKCTHSITTYWALPWFKALYYRGPSRAQNNISVPRSSWVDLHITCVWTHVSVLAQRGFQNLGFLSGSQNTSEQISLFQGSFFVNWAA